MKRGLAPLALVFVLVPFSQSHAASGILDEADVGLLAHDIPLGDTRQESGVDGNAELRFVSPDFLAPIFAPRPHVGISVNSNGGNSYAYAGLTWTANFSPMWYGNLGLGGAVHDGPDNSTDPTHKGLGTRALFHEYLELGAHISAPWSTSLFLDHVSNADIARHNPGLTNIGLRVGYSF
jgi:lipid A 3-O-deacylase